MKPNTWFPGWREVEVGIETKKTKDNDNEDKKNTMDEGIIRQDEKVEKEESRAKNARAPSRQSGCLNGAHSMSKVLDSRMAYKRASRSWPLSAYSGKSRRLKQECAAGSPVFLAALLRVSFCRPFDP